MKQLCTVLLTWMAAVCLSVGAAADVIGPGEALMRQLRRNPLPLAAAVAAVVLVTALLVRRSGKKK